MKRGKFLIPALAMLMCFSVGAGVSAVQSNNVNPLTVNAEDGMLALVLGDNTIPVTEDDISSGMILGMLLPQ